jgi:hypothetical protein
VWLALKDPKCWLQAIAVGAVSLNVAAFGTFLPTFIELFGFPSCKLFLAINLNSLLINQYIQ